MLTAQQHSNYTYKPAHDRPTPLTSRHNSPLSFDDPRSTQTQPSAVIPRTHSPPATHLMSAPHRGLPPPAAMAMPPKPPSSSAPHHHHHHHAPPPSAPPPAHPTSGGVTPSHSHLPSPQYVQPLGQLPAPPPHWQGTEDSMKNWLATKAEEEKRRQEEEKTRQEGLRLEQRRIEHDILKTALSGGIPPPIVPVIFAGMGGGNLPQNTMEWAQQFLGPSSQAHLQQLTTGQRELTSPDLRRDSYAPPYHPSYGTMPPTPGSAQPIYGGGYPASPKRARGQSVSTNRPPPISGSNSSSGNIYNSAHHAATSAGHPGQGQHQPPPQSLPSQPPMPQQSQSLPPPLLPPPQPQTQSAASQPQHPTPSGPGPSQTQAPPPSHAAKEGNSLSFHMWQPPGGSNPATPVGETPRKRKATGQQRHESPPAISEARFKSPPLTAHRLSNPPARRKAHSRQSSTASILRSSSLRRGEGSDSGGSVGPSLLGHRDRGEVDEQEQTGMADRADSGHHLRHLYQHRHQQQHARSSITQSVSSLLSPPENYDSTSRFIKTEPSYHEVSESQKRSKRSP